MATATCNDKGRYSTSAPRARCAGGAGGVKVIYDQERLSVEALDVVRQGGHHIRRYVAIETEQFKGVFPQVGLAVAPTHGFNDGGQKTHWILRPRRHS